LKGRQFNRDPRDKPLVIKEAWLRHAYLYMNLYGVPLDGSKILSPNGTKLWDELQSFKYRFVVDNHSPWEKFAKDETYAGVAFVLATTAKNERDRLLTLFEDDHGHRKEFSNVFFFGAKIDKITEKGYMQGNVMLERLDRDAISLKDKGKLDTIGNMLSPLGFRRPMDEPDEELERLKVLRQRGQDALQKEIEDKAQKCFKNYRLCTEVARMSLALLLEKEPAARHTFDRKGSANSFSDAGLVEDALFLKARIWSEDWGVREMATYCNVGSFRKIIPSILKEISP
jgi:hypothetical protein